jgi:CheY-like chemotaxis protein/anti-sigma regulatory factor (Ser/Thr protein kinase)
MKTILVVDDDPVVHHLLAAVLASYDWQMESAYDGAEGLECVRRKPYDLVLTDVRMPCMDGLELLGRIRELRPDTKVMVMTAESTPDSVIASIRQQAFIYFSKPFSPSAVAEMMEQALQSSSPSWQDDIEVFSAIPQWISLRVRCRPEVATRVLHFLREMKMDLPAQEREDIATAFHELLLNAIEYGGRSDPKQKIRVTYIRTARAVFYHIGDPGQGFSFDDLPHAAVSNPASAPMEHVDVRRSRGIRPGGFGIMLARNLADEVMYNEKGNEVLLIKYINRGNSHDEKENP